MSKSLLEQLPGIVAAGKRQAAQILEQLEGRNRVSLQTRELVIPAKDRGGFNFWGNDGDELRVVTTAVLDLPRIDGPRTVCVRAVDVFGFESEVVISSVEVQP